MIDFELLNNYYYFCSKNGRIKTWCIFTVMNFNIINNILNIKQL